MKENQFEIQDRVQKSHWWYGGRRRLLHNILLSLTSERGRIRSAVDVGCGVGGFLSVIRPFTERVIALDASEHARPFIEAKGYDVVEIAPLEAADSERIGSADLVVAMDVLEHIEDDRAGVRAIQRLLSPGGFAVVTVPAFPWLWGLQDEVSHHKRRYRMRELASLLESSGLRIVRKTYFNTILFVPIYFARQIMRLLRIRSVESENDVNSPFINSILKRIFLLEISGLRHGLTYPFGVSILIVVEKGQ